MVIRNDKCTPTFNATLFTKAKIWKQSILINRETDKDDVFYIYTREYCSAITKEWNLAILTANELKGYYGKWNESERERQNLYDFNCM